MAEQQTPNQNQPKSEPNKQPEEKQRTNVVKHAFGKKENLTYLKYRTGQDLYIPLTNLIRSLASQSKAFFQNIRNMAVYRAYSGKIPYLYRNYASKTNVTELRMKGDPVILYTETVFEYFQTLLNGLTQLNQQVSAFINKSISIYDVNELEKIWAPFYQGVKFSSQFGNTIKDFGKRVEFAIQYKVGAMLTLNDELTIPNVTMRSIGEKGFKGFNAKKIVISLFTDSQTENPEIQTVDSIFQGPASFDKIARFNDTRTQEIYNMINQMQQPSVVADHFYGFVKKTEVDPNNKDEKKRKVETSRFEELEKIMIVFRDAQMFINKMLYDYLDIGMRINHLCIRCLTEMTKVKDQFKIQKVHVEPTKRNDPQALADKLDNAGKSKNIKERRYVQSVDQRQSAVEY